MAFWLIRYHKQTAHATIQTSDATKKPVVAPPPLPHAELQYFSWAPVSSSKPQQYTSLCCAGGRAGGRAIVLPTSSGCHARLEGTT